MFLPLPIPKGKKFSAHRLQIYALNYFKLKNIFSGQFRGTRKCNKAVKQYSGWLKQWLSYRVVFVLVAPW